MLGIKKQLSHFIEFKEEKALLLNNYDWLGHENYLNFIREIGPYFSVNRMLTAECFKLRMEKGLTFLEFNYMLLQAFDFYTLSKKYNCKMEVGGDDQWSNILAGIELTRRKDQKEVFGLTVPLLSNSNGKKMGKTENGAVWLDPNLTSPYEYYQYWRNTTDEDVTRFMKLYTYISLEDIAEYGKWECAELNKAKEILAYETTKIVHGQEEADKARATAKSIFENQGGVADSAPTHELTSAEVIGQSVVDITVKIGLFDSKGEARRMITQGGLAINEAKVADINYLLAEKDVKEGRVSLRKGKKNYYFINVK
jgi:tyrosyl-tRNA synthetase